jgi:hypothetical protein
MMLYALVPLRPDALSDKRLECMKAGLKTDFIIAKKVAIVGYEGERDGDGIKWHCTSFDIIIILALIYCYR